MQQTPLAQKPVPHCDGVAQAPPCGTGVAVGVVVAVGVWVGVFVTVAVLVAVAVFVTVAVTVAVAVTVGVVVGVNAQLEPATVGSQQNPVLPGSHTSPNPDPQRLPGPNEGLQSPVTCTHEPDPPQA